MGLCLLYGREKSLELAIKHGEMGLEETERVKRLWLSSLIRLCMGISYVYSAKWEEALDVFYHCEEGFTQCGDRYGIALLYLWKAYIFYETERIGQFKHSMVMLLSTAKAEKYDYLFIQRTAFSPRDIRRLVPLFLEAQKLGIESSYVSYILECIGLNNAVTHPGYTLRIRTLGQFQVWLGDSEVEEKDWQRGKAKELLQLFVTKRRMLIPKDQILAALWPDMDEEAANRDFKVALNALNRALEPQRTARANPYFLQKNGSSYGIHGTNDIELDVSDFEESIQRGLESDDLNESEQLLMSGLQLYRGDYLPEARYEDKYVEERERLQVLFLRGAEKLSRLSLDQDKLDQTIYWCEQILSKDSCWEEAYRLLVMCNYRKRNRTQALRWLQKCRAEVSRMN